MLIDSPSPREYRVAQWLFWVLMAAMLALIYRDIWLGAWSEVVAIEEGWLQQRSPIAESVTPLPEIMRAEHIDPKAPPLASTPHDPPQTVGDVIADLQQQDVQQRSGP